MLINLTNPILLLNDVQSLGFYYYNQYLTLGLLDQFLYSVVVLYIGLQVRRVLSQQVTVIIIIEEYTLPLWLFWSWFYPFDSVDTYTDHNLWTGYKLSMLIHLCSTPMRIVFATIAFCRLTYFTSGLNTFSINFQLISHLLIEWAPSWLLSMSSRMYISAYPSVI